MTIHLNQQREAELTPVRMNRARTEIWAKGYAVITVSDTELQFELNGNIIRYFPYSGWAQGKGIRAGRGLRNLIRQI